VYAAGVGNCSTHRNFGKEAEGSMAAEPIVDGDPATARYERSEIATLRKAVEILAPLAAIPPSGLFSDDLHVEAEIRRALVRDQATGYERIAGLEVALAHLINLIEIALDRLRSTAKEADELLAEQLENALSSNEGTPAYLAYCLREWRENEDYGSEAYCDRVFGADV
jgi:hypothetical protein